MWQDLLGAGGHSNARVDKAPALRAHVLVQGGMKVNYKRRDYFQVMDRYTKTTKCCNRK